MQWDDKTDSTSHLRLFPERRVTIYTPTWGENVLEPRTHPPAASSGTFLHPCTLSVLGEELSPQTGSCSHPENNQTKNFPQTCPFPSCWNYNEHICLSSRREGACFLDLFTAVLGPGTAPFRRRPVSTRPSLHSPTNLSSWALVSPPWYQSCPRVESFLRGAPPFCKILGHTVVTLADLDVNELCAQQELTEQNSSKIQKCILLTSGFLNFYSRKKKHFTWGQLLSNPPQC